MTGDIRYPIELPHLETLILKERITSMNSIMSVFSLYTGLKHLSLEHHHSHRLCFLLQ
ncbi:hypothetical protein BD408DRAFT_423368 [Parasitella parasitica]|nr:hypothetical protein BD408DRAFT_423368 [Parasitella parasitica]